MIRAWILWAHHGFYGPTSFLGITNCWGEGSLATFCLLRYLSSKFGRQWVHSLAWIFFASRNPYGSYPVATVPIMNWASIQWIMRFSYGFCCFNSEIVYRLIWSWDWQYLNTIPPGSNFLQSSRDFQLEPWNTNATDLRSAMQERSKRDAQMRRFRPLLSFPYSWYCWKRIGRSSKCVLKGNQMRAKTAQRQAFQAHPAHMGAMSNRLCHGLIHNTVWS